VIKLLALDLDGTLLNSQGKISPKNRKAIRDAEDKGVLVTFATGRRFRDARPAALEVGFNAPIVTHNGALVKNAETRETSHHSLLETNIALKITQIGRQNDADALVSIDPIGDGSLIYEKISKENRPLREYIVWARKVHGADGAKSVHNVGSLDVEIPENDVVHISFSGPCGSMDGLENILAAELGGSVNILATVYPRLDFTLIDVLPPTASKATGVHHIAKLHGLHAENVMVIGDNRNDLEMLEWAGTPIVMGNATRELLARDEFHKTSTNDEDGVAHAIEKFILDRV